MSVSVLPVSKVIVKSLLNCPRKVLFLLDRQKNFVCAPVYIGKVVLDIYIKLCTCTVT